VGDWRYATVQIVYLVAIITVGGQILVGVGVL